MCVCMSVSVCVCVCECVCECVYVCIAGGWRWWGRVMTKAFTNSPKQDLVGMGPRLGL